MAEYTIELRTIIEGGVDIFRFPYEFYDDAQRKKFERDFIRHFYFREIGVPSIDRFILNLEDKMNTVFPVYNAMLKAGQIKYNVLDNYYLSETTKRTFESEGKSSGVSSTVGQTFDDQQTDTTDVSKGNSETIGHSETDNTVTNTGTVTKVTDGETTVDQTIDKKFLDTPQGLTDLTDSKYLTTLNQDKTNGKTNTDDTVTDTTDLQTVTDGQTDTRDTVTTNNETTGSVTVKGEQRTTADNNTRTRNDNRSSEETEVIHKGNIGVDSDAVMIQKHLKLQQLIANTFKMFFDECEDLFMMVY